MADILDSATVEEFKRRDTSNDPCSDLQLLCDSHEELRELLEQMVDRISRLAREIESDLP